MTAFVNTLLASVSLSYLISGVSAGGTEVLSVEPYIAEWCAAVFPDQIKGWTGYNSAHLMRFRDYKRIEPVMGNYCFDQFPEELRDQNRQGTLDNMADDHHVQIEPYLMKWGDRAMVNPVAAEPGKAEEVELEPYLAEWCVKGQFHRLMSDTEQSMRNAAANPLSVEPVFGRWCFSQFKDELSSLDVDTAVSSLGDNEPIEDYLMKWEMAIYGMGKAQHYQNNLKDDAISAAAGFGIALAVTLPIIFACWCWRKRDAAKQAQFQRDVQMTEDSLAQGTA